MAWPVTSIGKSAGASSSNEVAVVAFAQRLARTFARSPERPFDGRDEYIAAGIAAGITPPGIAAGITPRNTYVPWRSPVFIDGERAKVRARPAYRQRASPPGAPRSR